MLLVSARVEKQNNNGRQHRSKQWQEETNVLNYVMSLCGYTDPLICISANEGIAFSQISFATVR
jgi:hypothetical protein